MKIKTETNTQQSTPFEGKIARGASNKKGEQMNTQINRTVLLILSAFVIAMTSLAFDPTLALAATNQATGDIGGTSADLTDSNVFNLTSQQLALIKTAYDAGGTQIADAATLVKGSTVKFLIYINNKADAATNDISIRDVLAATFLYTAGTLKTSVTVNACALLACSTAEEDAIFANVDGTSALSDTVDGDAVSFASLTVDVGNQNVANAVQNIPANKVFAVVMTVVLQ